MNALLQSPEFTLDRSRHAAPQVFERLRDMIIDMSLTPGTVLSRTELAARFGLSQTPIRDALQRLGEEGLVDIFPQHATVVRPIEVALAREAHFLRSAIELEVVHTLAERQDATLIARLKSNLARQRALAEEDDVHEFSQADQAFHQMMYVAAGVPNLWHIVRSQSGHIDRLRRLDLPSPGKRERVLADHAELVGAIEQRDAALAQTVLRRHLSGTLSNIEEIRERHPSYVR
ncbi:GntR family transcriptional regulator [Massilia sp. 9096]|uniref:GntR family transcriptional regulator n=1 Tax=Massilia sp. 9096 TaxID=1500894 RepID=UPI0005664B68|nr:GntR family transcriptional regulator [Massilia sp. 9096]